MKSIFRRKRLGAILLVASLVAAWWMTLAPRAVGGHASYVVVSGTSMQPTYHTDDLVVVRARSAYHVGEIVAFSVDGGHVIHRILAGSAKAGWQTKGINKNTPDLWVIPNDHILGAAWFSVPHGGRDLRWVGTPLGRAALAGVLALLVALVPGRHRRRAGPTQPVRTSRWLDVLVLAAAAGVALTGLTVVAAVSGGLGGLVRLPGIPFPIRVRALGFAALALLAPSLPLIGLLLLQGRDRRRATAGPSDAATGPPDTAAGPSGTAAGPWDADTGGCVDVRDDIVAAAATLELEAVLETSAPTASGG